MEPALGERDDDGREVARGPDRILPQWSPLLVSGDFAIVEASFPALVPQWSPLLVSGTTTVTRSGAYVVLAVAAMVPALGERDDYPGTRGIPMQARQAAMEPALGERDDGADPRLDQPAGHLAAMEPALGERDDRSAIQPSSRPPAPQWSPLLVSGTTYETPLGPAGYGVAAMEPALGERDDPVSPETVRRQLLEPQWSPLLVSGTTAREKRAL